MALRVFGFEVKALRDVYPNDAQDVEDIVWIRDSAREGYIVFTANPHLLLVPHEKEAVREHRAKVFCLSSANHTLVAQALIFGRHLLRIVRRANKPGPCFWRLKANQQVTYDIP